MSKFTIIISKAPYGQEKPFTALKFAQASFQHKVNIFLVEDGVYVAKKGQDADMRIEDMLREVIKNGSSVLLCVSCTEVRGLTKEEIVEGSEIGTMADLVKWVDESDKVLIF